MSVTKNKHEMYILNSTNMELEPSFVYLVADKVKSQ